MFKRYLGVSLLTAGMLVAGCSSNDDKDPVVETPTYVAPEGTVLNLIETAEEQGTFTQLLAAIETAGLTATLSSDTGVYTVFAPTDDAFAALPAGTVEGLSAEELLDLLQYHVNDNSAGLDSAALIALDGTNITMLDSKAAAISVVGGNVMIGTATVTTADVYATNGIVHVIDQVLAVPADPVIVDPVEGEHVVAELTNLGNYSVLVNGMTTHFPGTFEADNGGEGWTIFAPNDAAFSAAGTTSLAAATDLTLYTIGSTIAADALVDGTLTVISGDVLTVTSSGGITTVGGATVTDSMTVGNGVIHFIDNVVVPN